MKSLQSRKVFSAFLAVKKHEKSSLKTGQETNCTQLYTVRQETLVKGHLVILIVYLSKFMEGPTRESQVLDATARVAYKYTVAGVLGRHN